MANVLGMDVENSKDSSGSVSMADAGQNIENTTAAPIEKFDMISAPLDFDVSRYISRYSGKTCLNRLFFIAERCPELAPESYRIALSMIKQGFDIHAYQNLMSTVGAHIEPQGGMDKIFLEQAEKHTRQEIEILESELFSQKMSLNRDEIRKLYLAIGNVYCSRGDLQSAANEYARMRTYCTDSSLLVEMGLNIIRVSIDSDNLYQATIHLNRCQQISPMSPMLEAQVKASAGLVHLFQKDYAECARNLMKVGPELMGTFNSVICIEDVAIYGSLCALMSLSRSEIKANLKENAAFSAFLELVPQFKHLVDCFLNGSYSSCISQLEILRNDLLLDIYIGKHVSAIFDGITDSCLLQYLMPYKCARILDTANSIGISQEKVEDSVVRLTNCGRIRARIDAVRGAILFQSVDKRRKALEAAISLGSEARSELWSSLIRFSCVEHGLVVVLNKNYNENSGKVPDIDGQTKGQDYGGFSIGGIPC